MRPPSTPPASRFLLRWLLLLLLLLPALSRAQTPWIQSQRVGTEVRFLYGNSIQRYNLATRTWLTAITLPRSGATAFTGDDLGNVVAYGTSIYRYNSSWASEVASGTTNSAISHLFIDGTLLIAVHSAGLYGRITTITRGTGTVITTKEAYVDSMYGASHAPGINRLYGRTSGISPADIVSASYTTAGAITGPSGGPYHGDYPDAQQTFVFPDERKVVDSSGTVYTSDSLVFAGSFGGTITDIDWNGDVPIVLRGTNLIAFRNTLTETGRITVTSGAAELAVTSSDAFVFRPNTGAPSVQIVALTLLNAPNPGENIDPNGLPFTADDTFIDKNGIIHLYSKAQMALFRWSPAERKYLSSLTLPGAPAIISYSAPNHTLYSLYSGNASQLRKLDLNSPSPQEALFVNLASAASGLATAGDMTFTERGGRIIIHSATGTILNDTVGSYTSAHKRWDPVRRRMYHFRDGISPNDLIYESIAADGKLTETIESPYHGDYSFYAPILISPDGNRIVIGSGVVFNADNLNRVTTLPNTISDGVWKGSTLVTIRLISGLTQLQTWTGANFSTGPTIRQFTGTPVRIFNSPSGLTVITSVDGTPRFSLLDDSFSTIYTTPTKPVAPGEPTVTTRSVSSVSLSWPDLSDNETGFRIEFRPATGLAPWSTGTTSAANTTSATVTGLTANTIYEFRVLALNDALVSDPSPALSARTLSSPEEPAGEPYNLTVTRIFHNSITLSWSDNASNETGFRVLRSLSAGGATTTISLGPNATSYTDNSLSANTTYFYRVQAFNGTFDADLSAQVSGRTLNAAAAPTAPSALTVSEITTTSARLTWTDNSTNENSFSVDRSTVPAGTWTTAGNVGFNVRTFVLNGLSSGTAYSLRVRATNPTGSSTSAVTTFSTLKLGGDFTGIAQQFGTTYLFAFSGPDRLERYDLTTRAWLAPIPMSAPATSLWIDNSGIYAAESRDLIRWNLDGTNRSIFFTSPSPLTGLFAIGDVLAAFGSGYTTLDKSSGIVLASFSTNYPPAGISVDPFLNRAFSRSLEVTPSDIQFLDIGPDGKLIRSANSPYHGDYPEANRTFVFPRGGRVADDSGSVYTTDGLVYLKSLGAPFKDLAFRGSDIPIVLRGNRLSALTNALTEAGSFTLSSANGTRVAVNGSDAIVFHVDGANPRGLSIQSVPLASLNAPLPDQPINPNGLAFSVDDAFADKNGDLLLLNKANLSVFRWSTSLKAYNTSLPLNGAPNAAAYSPLSHRLFTAYGSSSIRQLDFTQPSPAEAPFASFTWAPRGLAVAGEFLFASADGTVRILSDSGATVSAPPSLSYTGAQNTWDPVRRRIYHFRDGTSPNDLHFDNLSLSGSITGGGESPYHGDIRTIAPIRVSTDGEFIALGSGEIFNATGLTRATRLPVTISDMTWKGRTLFSIETESPTITRVQRWSSSWQRDKSVALGGTPLRIFSLPSAGFAVITLHSNGVPRFHLLDENLNYSFDSVPTPPAIIRQPQSQRVDFGQPLRLEVLASGSPPLSYQWFFNNTIIPGATDATYQIPAPGSLDAGSYRVTISNGTVTVGSANALVAVGPATPQLFSPGSLLVATGGALREYRPNGTLIRSVAIPVAPGTPPATTTGRTFDVVIDRLGVVHVVNVPQGVSNPVFHLSSYDPILNTWKHTPIPGMQPYNFSDANLSITGDWIAVQDGRYNLFSGEWIDMPQTWFPDKVAAAPDGRIYGMARYGEMRQLITNPISWAPSVALNGAGESYGFAADSNGNLFTANTAYGVTAFSPNGTITKSLTVNSVPAAGFIQDIDLLPNGTISLGHTGNFVSVIQPGLVSPVTFAVGTPSGSSGTFTTWIPTTTLPSPAFAQSPPPPATEDVPWQWSPAVSHPDPDAVLTVSALSLPSWLRLENGTLSGTPLAANIGTQSFRLKVTDALGMSSEQSFSISVAEVNDAPIAVNRSLDRPEDSPAEAITLTDLISDEESATLTWNITGSTGSTISSEISGNRLLISYLPNAHGIATVRIRGTDDGFRFAESLITVNVSPVNDAPTGSLAPVSANEDSAPITIDLADSFADIESPDSALTFSYVSSGPEIAGVSLNGSTLTISPRPNANGSFTITVRATDPEGLFVEATTNVTLIAVNDTPTGSLNPISANEDAPPISINLADSFADIESPDSALTFTALSSRPDIATVSVLAGNLTLTPLTNANGSLTITVRATDPEGLFVDVPTSVTIIAVNDTPTGSLNPISANEDAAPITINLADSFADIESPDSALTFTALSSRPDIATVSVLAGNLTLTPLPNANGALTITVRASDPEGLFVDVTTNVTIIAVNDTPSGSLNPISANEDAPPITINLADSFADIESPDSALTFTALSSRPDIASVSINGTFLTITPGKDANGSLTITVRATDPEGLFVDVLTSVTLFPVNDPPVIPAAIPDVAANDAGSNAVIDFSPLVSDPDSGDVITWRVIGNTNPALFSELSFDPQGRLTIRYAPYVSGEAAITVSVSDAAGTVAQRSFKIVLPALPPPAVTTQGTLTLNRQTGLWEHRVTVRNIGQRAIGGFEIHVAGLPANASLYNASDCLTGLPCAIYHQPVAPGQSVSMVLEYNVSNRSPLAPPTLTTVPILPHDVSSPASSGALAIDVAMLLKPGMFMIEFPSEPGVLYQIQYSDDGLNWLDSLSRIRAAGTRTQWIDQGAPRTASPPGSGTRFYRVKRIAGS